MAILKVAQLGHPILRVPAQEVPVDAIASPVFQRFLDDLLETMDEYDGAGLAAPQVHTSLRAVVLVLDPEKGPEFLINPVLRPLGEELTETVEGCLSVEGLRGVVRRPARIRLDALDRDGTPKAYELHGFPAVVAQHECDHLDGVLYVDKVDPGTLAFLEEFERYGRLDRAEGRARGPGPVEPLIRKVAPQGVA
ncbi:MAG: peptide deformylase [Alphaproteobacteria bacterium]|nr:peptide deformylase [Alphaproteobacteria bacterium]